MASARALLLAALLAMAAAPAPDAADLRDLRVGARVADLPAAGFAGLRCEAAPATALAGWQDWQRCPADAAGHRAIRFGYATGDTMVAGHPVLLTAVLGADARLDELRIVTDPAARLFLRKKAFLLGLQARGRYGDEGWTCRAAQPGPDAEPVGGVFVAETCRKSLPGKTLLVERTLLRRPGTELKAFIGESRITITAAP